VGCSERIYWSHSHIMNFIQDDQDIRSPGSSRPPLRYHRITFYHEIVATLIGVSSRESKSTDQSNSDDTSKQWWWREAAAAFVSPADLVEERNASLAVINSLTASPAAATSYNENKIACRHIPCEVGISRSILSISSESTTTKAYWTNDLIHSDIANRWYATTN
jgi:hypothetical protein